jgi:D-sedoheptulose 7-phosphate isomerase
LFRELIAANAAAHQKVFADFAGDHLDILETTGRLMGEALKAGAKILICGNGGSAADAQHMAGEIVGRFLTERRPYPAIALNTDTSTLTAIANDYGYEEIFARQVRGHGRPGDVLVAISTSGNSPNVLRAIEAAREIGMVSIALTGRDGGKMKSLCDHAVVVASPDTPRIQECHIFTIHTWCGIVDGVVGV